MIYKLELQNHIEETCWFPTINDAVDDLIYRNKAAGRDVEIKKTAKNAVQFCLTYPNLNRTLKGTVSLYGRGGRMQLDPKEIVDEVKQMTKQGMTKVEMCRILAVSSATLANAKRIIDMRKRARKQREKAN